MSYDKLLVIFIIIILPLAVLLNTYVNSQADTLKMQSLYDSKLYSATNDALKAYQSNAFNESSSKLATLHVNNVEASANVFLRSIASNFSMSGFSESTIKSHIPAIVFTGYDGFYIYSKYKNDLEGIDLDKDSVYKDEERIYGVKPYIQYSCRYQFKGNDFVITYSLDNYITIQGKINGKWINDSGYVIDTSKIAFAEDGSSLSYRNIQIKGEELLKEYVGTTLYPYVKINGIKYYYDEQYKNSKGDTVPTWFILNNGTRNYQSTYGFDLYYDYSAYNYYKDAYDFTNRLIDEYELDKLTVENAVDAYDISESAENNENFFSGNFSKNNGKAEIFKLNDKDVSSEGVSIEEPLSNFNQHRLAVIRYCIEKNLSIAIANYNTFDTSTTNYQMPVLNDSEWEKILNNIGIISFMQGLPMGNKFYNGCAVVSNNKNDEVISESSIYIVNMPDRNAVNKQGESNAGGSLYYYYDIKKKDWGGISPVGVLNSDLEKRYYFDEDSGDLSGDYYYPKLYYADYGSIITSSDNVNISADETDTNKKMYALGGNIYKYMEKYTNTDVATAYFTALARERYSSYKASKMTVLPDNISVWRGTSEEGNLVGNGHRYCVFDNTTKDKFGNNIFSKTVSWFEAEAYCQSLGGHLVTITSEEEQEYVNGLLKNDGNRYWIGATDEKEEGIWRWIDTDEIFYDKANDSGTYSNWSKNSGFTQPDNLNGNQNYANIQAYGNEFAQSGYWDDDSGTRLSDSWFICEWDN